MIKRYENGELSRWVHKLQAGDEVRVRGPVVTWDYRDGAFDEVIFVRHLSFAFFSSAALKLKRLRETLMTPPPPLQIVGGTGITPAHQLVSHLLDQRTSPPKLSVIYASPTPSTILLKDSLDGFARHPSKQVQVTYLVDGLDRGTKAVAGGPLVGRVDGPVLEKLIGAGGRGKRRVVVVCGPEACVFFFPLFSTWC